MLNTLPDTSASGSHDLWTTQAQFSSDSAPVVGDWSLAFDGIDQFVNLSNGSGTLTHDAFTERTIAFHFKPATGGSAIQTLYEEGDASGGGLAIRLDNGKLKVRFVSDGQTLELHELHYVDGQWVYEDFIDLPDPTDTWHHLTLVFGDVYTGDVVLYLDGVAVANVAVMTLGGEFATLGTMQQRQGDAGLGATVGSDAYGDSSPNLFTGLIDDLRLYDVALWSDNVARLAQGLEPTSQGSGNPPPPAPAPIAHWTMEPVEGVSPENRVILYGYGAGTDLSDPTQPVHGSGTRQTAKVVLHPPDYDGDTYDFLSRTDYLYDASGRMTQVEIDSDGDAIVDETTTYQYDDRNLRVGETTGSETKSYLFGTQNPTRVFPLPGVALRV